MVEKKVKKKSKKKKGAIFYAPIRTKEDLIQELSKEDVDLEDLAVRADVEEDKLEMHTVKMLEELKRLSKKDKGRYIT